MSNPSTLSPQIIDTDIRIAEEQTDTVKSSIARRYDKNAIFISSVSSDNKRKQIIIHLPVAVVKQRSFYELMNKKMEGK